MDPLILYGEAALSENMFLFNIVYDIILLNAVIGGTIIASNRRDTLKEKYGINQ